MKFIIHLLFVFLFLFATALDSVAKDEKTFLIMELANSEQPISFSLEENPEISFAENRISVICRSNDGSTKTEKRDFSDVENFHFELRTNALHSLKLQNEFEVQWIDADNLIIRSEIKDISPIRVYNMSGAPVDCNYENVSDNSYSLNLSHLLKGVYIITFNNHSSIKIIKR